MVPGADFPGAVCEKTMQKSGGSIGAGGCFLHLLRILCQGTYSANAEENNSLGAAVFHIRSHGPRHVLYRWTICFFFNGRKRYNKRFPFMGSLGLYCIHRRTGNRCVLVLYRLGQHLQLERSAFEFRGDLDILCRLSPFKIHSRLEEKSRRINHRRSSVGIFHKLQ